MTTNNVTAISLPASKSISNRLLILQALSTESITIENLSNANDTVVLNRVLYSEDAYKNVQDAGTAMRFSTAYFAVQNSNIEIGGSKRMHQRPIGQLVDALREIGATINYLQEEGFPPLRIGAFTASETQHITLNSSISSQFITALMMVAPCLPNGLTITLKGNTVSKPYIMMTAALMKSTGAEVRFTENRIEIPHHTYKSSRFAVESDWSAASYFYAYLALAKNPAPILLKGLFPDSIQGDAEVMNIFQHFGIATSFQEDGAFIEKVSSPSTEEFHYDFTNQPDLVQTVVVCAAALGIKATLSGIQSLRIKETDRVVALQQELRKLGVEVVEKDNTLFIENAPIHHIPNDVIIHTYEDHRMAMAFAPLLTIGKIAFDERDVVKKSFPDFWKEFNALLSL